MIDPDQFEPGTSEWMQATRAAVFTHDFSWALHLIKQGGRATRLGWRGRPKWIALQPSDGRSVSYLELRYTDGTRSPWTPTRCDMLEEDWGIAS